ncbi:complement C5 [Mugil cephalus]|uniref:complement C5 n=1 Tax=Mugil cephalus TaxID=48193 RepID=UPI001FB74CD8|nr:complement C5 [Mugil cephalus]
MKLGLLLLLLLLLCASCLWGKTDAESRSYLITAPRSLRLDAVETVVLQLFGFTDDVTVYLELKTSLASDHVLLAKEIVTLNAQNQHQAAAKIRLDPAKLPKSVNNVILHVISPEINKHQSIAVSRTNGFLFIQTDKPLYTPHQTVKVRAFSLNQELRPANRSVSLVFRDPDYVIVDMVQMVDMNNGIPSMENPFRIPIKPKFGVWFIEASYSGEFTTAATTDFEVKEYVLPSISIQVEPEANYISHGSFSSFNFKVRARYLHGAPVSDGIVLLRYGYVSGKDRPVIVPNYVIREGLSSAGEVDVTVNMEEVLSKHDPPKDFTSVVGKYLYIAIFLEERSGGITQESEFTSVKFVKSPYRLSLVSTPPFIKPGLPYYIQVVVKDHLDKPVSRVPVRVLEQQLFTEGGATSDLSCPLRSQTRPDGRASFLCNTPTGGLRAVLKFETDDPSLPPSSQASLTLEAIAYHSPNHRYLYIDPPMQEHGLVVGGYAQVKVYLAMPSYLPLKSISYLILSKGKIVHFGIHTFVPSSDNKQTINFMVTASMVPSIRLLAYFIVHGEGVSELVADSIWLDVTDHCVNRLQTSVTLSRISSKPKEKLNLDIRTNQNGLVALSAVDSALFVLRPTYKDPVAMVLRHIERSDQGCGGGGGKDNADVFRLAGLTFITNANAMPSSSNEACEAVVRTRRAVTEQQKKEKARTYGRAKPCCELGMDYLPKILTCQQFAEQSLRNRPQKCIDAFRECCEFTQEKLDQDETLILGRHDLGPNFDQAPSLVRSYFPESWLWEVHPVRSGLTPLSKTLPDSLTTWDIKAVGVFHNGICVAEPVQVSVSLPLSVDVPLPYQVVRGEQLELSGSVYNQLEDRVKYCVTLSVGPAICLMDSRPLSDELHSTTCTWKHLSAGGVGKVTFTLLGLEPGEHTLTFSLRTFGRLADVVKKKLRVVPEGLRREQFSAGLLDPQGVYGTEKMSVELKNKPPANMVPNTDVERMLTVNGEIPGEAASIVNDPDGLRQLVNLPAGSAEAELAGLLPLLQVYQYLEKTRSWGVLGRNIDKNSADMRQKIREGLISISSFRGGDSGYSMWMKREPSTWLTALVVKTLSLADGIVSVSHQSLSESVSYLIYKTQQPDGSFADQRLSSTHAAGGVDRSVYLTSFVLIALYRATRIQDQILQLQFQYNSMRSAVDYLSQHALQVKSMYVRSVAVYALTLYDTHDITASQLLDVLEKKARQKGHPAVLRYWQESSETVEWLKPDESSGQTVEMTAYVLLTVLLKGRIHYATPILSWLTQDQHYGQGFYSVQDLALSLEAATEYSSLVSRAVLDQDIIISYKRKGRLGNVIINQTHPVATPIMVTRNDDIRVYTGYGKGVSSVKMRTVFYQTTASAQDRCHFDISIEVAGPGVSDSPRMTSPHLVACVKYKPPPNEVLTESGLTVLKIELPTGVEPRLEDLRQFRDGDEPVVSHYELQGSTVVIQMDAVPSTTVLCVGFRVRTTFTVGGVAESLFSVSEVQDKGSLCTKQFSFQEQKLQRLCVGDQCQCMLAACAAYRGDVDPTLTADDRRQEICRPRIRYAYRLVVKSSAPEGDFLTYKASVEEVLRRPARGVELDAVAQGTEVELVKKATCNGVNLQDDKQYLVMGTSGTEVALTQGYKYRLPLDSDALVEAWPKDCSIECSELDAVALDLQLEGCP